MNWNEDTLRNFIVYWNNRYPFDYWWRKKHNIPFNSPQHREMCLIDIKFEYDEEKLVNYYIESSIVKKEDRDNYKETGKWLKKSKPTITQEALDDLYDNLDLSQFDKIKFPQSK